MRIVIISCVVLSVIIHSSAGAELSRRFMFPSGFGGSSCQTSLAGCSLHCPNGYMTGSNGCYYCACANSGPSGPSGPMSGPQGMSNPFSGGYQSGTNPAGNPSQQQQQQLAHGQCLKSASDCACKVVQMHVSYPCYYCDCSGTNTTVPPTPSLMTAAPPMTTTPKQQTPTPKAMTSSPVQTTPPPVIVLTTRDTPTNVTSGGDYCAIAAQLCEKGCKGGYLVDPSDCTYCVCKSQLGTSIDY